MPVVTVQMEKGRPVKMKRALSEAVTTAVAVALDIPPHWVTLIIDEVERENWAVGGRLQLFQLRLSFFLADPVSFGLFPG